jgi:Tol biopolymer transport system component
VFSQLLPTRGAADLMTITVSGKDLRRVTSLRGAELEPAWSPDGRTILFTYEHGHAGDEAVDVMSVRPNGSELRTVLATPGLDYSPSWSPSGHRIALYSDGRRPFGDSPRPGAWILRPGSERQLVVQGRAVAYVDW